jgi:hypothetical protein
MKLCKSIQGSLDVIRIDIQVIVCVFQNLCTRWTILHVCSDALTVIILIGILLCTPMNNVFSGNVLPLPVRSL